MSSKQRSLRCASTLVNTVLLFTQTGRGNNTVAIKFPQINHYSCKLYEEFFQPIREHSGMYVQKQGFKWTH